ncbi:MAG: hypothetical protein FWG62_09985 [Proteobacteria bacterium]|nr:hypothetical protein [Pseudomonadota bacterium]
MHLTGRFFIFLMSCCWMALLFGTWAAADDDQDTILVGRVTHVEGGLLRYVAENKDWVVTVQDAPFGLEDALYADNDAKAEFILPNRTWIRIGGNTQIQMIALNPETTMVDVASGLARMYNKNQNTVIKATTPFGYVVAPEGAVFDLYVGDESMELIAIRGTIDFIHEATGSRYEVREQEASLIADSRGIASGNGTVDAAWDDWNGRRDSLWAQRLHSQGQGTEYLPVQIRDQAYALEENGRWERVYYEGDYRAMWRPTKIVSGWRPFTEGRWSVYYGDNCWIPAEPFGYVTHHYGSWVWVDSFRSWYWMPPVARVIDTAPGLSIGFGWYPGRVGWIYSNNSIGWIPLAPNENYYCHHPWGRRVVVINRTQAVNINISRYRYLDRAVIISADHLYRGNRYTPFVQLMNKNAIVSSYKTAPVLGKNVISTYDSDQRRFSFNDAKVDRKPHGSVLGRVDNNRRLYQNAGPLGREQIRQDLDQVVVTAMPKTTAIRNPKVSSKVVTAAQANQPVGRVSFPTRELKPNDRQRQLMNAGPGQTVGPRSRGEGSQIRPAPGQKDDTRRMRSTQEARDQVMQDIGPTAPATKIEKPSIERRPGLQNRQERNQGASEPGDQGNERRIRSPRETPSLQQSGPPFPQRPQPRETSPREDVQRQQEFKRQQEDQQRQQQESIRRQQEESSRRQQQLQQQEIQRRQEDQQRQQQELIRRQQEESSRRQQQLQQQEFKRRQEDQQRQQQESIRRQQEESSRRQQQLQQQEIQRRQEDQRQQQETIRRQQEESSKRQQQLQQQQQQELQRRQDEQQRQGRRG